MLSVGVPMDRSDLRLQSIFDYNIVDLDMAVNNVSKALSALARKSNRDSGNLARTRGDALGVAPIPKQGGGNSSSLLGVDTTPPISDIGITIPDPRNRKAAIQSPFWPHLQEAEVKEIASLAELRSWDLVHRNEVPRGQLILRGRWVYAFKRDAQGKVIKVKARFTIMGCQQTRGVDFKETFASTMSIKTFRIALAIANLYEDVEVDQWDAKCAYINSPVEEGVRIYCQQPEGHIDPKHPRKVCLLRKSMYGLKQAGRSWQIFWKDI